VKMPGAVTEVKQEVPLGNGMKMRVFAYASGEPGKGFVATHTLLPAGAFKGTSEADAFTQLKTGFASTLPAGSKVLSETPIKLGKYSGREWSIDTPGKGKSKVRMYIVGDSSIALVAGSMPPITDDEAKTF